MACRLFNCDVENGIINPKEEVLHILQSKKIRGKTIALIYSEASIASPFMVTNDLQFHIHNSISLDYGTFCCETIEKATEIYASFKEETCDDEYNMVFVLGYDLLQDFLNERACECDVAFNFCKAIYNLFLKSEENDVCNSEYDCLQMFVSSLKIKELDDIFKKTRNEE